MNDFREIFKNQKCKQEGSLEDVSSSVDNKKEGVLSAIGVLL